jgi:HPt (histidine-containing phosphotransfer) domain-containing protein
LTDAADDTLRPALAGLWTESRPRILGRGALESALLDDHRAGPLEPDRRPEAEHEAHKLAGSVGTFGFMQTGQLAKEAELLLEGDTPLGPAQVETLSHLVSALAARLNDA